MAFRRRPAAKFLAAAAVVLFGALGFPPPAATADPGPGRADLPGVDVRPSPRRQRLELPPRRKAPTPVILVHGTGMDMGSWGALSPALQREGYCVFALDYGLATGAWGRGDIRASAVSWRASSMRCGPDRRRTGGRRRPFPGGR